MFGTYCADSALGIAIGEALGFYGLETNLAAASRRPVPARTLGEQTRRIDLAGKVLALVRQKVAVGADDRRLIERLVDSACQRLEDVDLGPPVPRCSASTAAVVAYAAAGGGALGSFESFRRRFTSPAELLEPEAVAIVDRQDVRPAPLTTNPNRRPPTGKPPGSSAPLKTNPTRTIRSSRWTATGKAVRS
jgi:hypothetical protein